MNENLNYDTTFLKVIVIVVINSFEDIYKYIGFIKRL